MSTALTCCFRLIRPCPPTPAGTRIQRHQYHGWYHGGGHGERDHAALAAVPDRCPGRRCHLVGLGRARRHVRLRARPAAARHRALAPQHGHHPAGRGRVLRRVRARRLAHASRRGGGSAVRQVVRPWRDRSRHDRPGRLSPADLRPRGEGPDCRRGPGFLHAGRDVRDGGLARAHAAIGRTRTRRAGCRTRSASRTQRPRRACGRGVRRRPGRWQCTRSTPHPQGAEGRPAARPANQGVPRRAGKRR
jgi:hypothetical protein